MFEGLISILEVPSLYQKTRVPFWNDNYISQQMLKAHLDPNFDGASRKLDFINKSVNWINKIAPPQKYKSLIDLGCGPGIYAEKFATSGYKVTGIDFSKHSIDYAINSAARKKLNIEYIYQDYLHMDLTKSFDFSTMIYCDYGALSSTDRKIVLETVYHHLKKGGRFLFDVFSLNKYKFFDEKQWWEICCDGGFWSNEKYIQISRNYRYSECVTLEQTAIISQSGTVAVYYIWNTYFSVESLIKETAAVGFKVCDVFSDVAGKEYREDSPTISILLEK